MMNNLKKKNKKKKGFTLIELIIVIAIIAVLAAIAVPQFGKIRQNANVNTDIANAKTIHSAVAALVADEEITIPISDEKIDSTTNVGQYLETVPTAKAYQKYEFYYSVDSDAKITISVGNGTVSHIVYPNPATTSIYGK